MIIITQAEIEKRIIEKFPNEPFEIIEYTKVSKPFTIKCLKCGKIKTYSTFNNYIGSSRKGVCSCYNSNNALTKHDNNKNIILEKIKNNPNQDFINFGYKENTKKYTVEILCQKCHQNFIKPWADYLKHSDCPYCENKQKMNTEAFRSLLSDEYQLLSEYNGSDKKILVKHTCGFIWKASAHSFLSYTGCPKCNHKRSKGERKIGQILDNNYIPYSIEQSFPWQSNLKRRYDFYLPEQNLIIEYMGEQHYRESSLFGIPLKEQQEIDRIKKEEAIKNGYNYCAISYKDFGQLDVIINQLIGSTTSSQNVVSSETKE